VYNFVLAGLQLDATEVNAIDVCANVKDPKQKGATEASTRIPYRRLLQGVSMASKVKDQSVASLPSSECTTSTQNQRNADKVKESLLFLFPLCVVCVGVLWLMLIT
jgi:hypothetical protein